jgi:hypothetical protein
MATSDGFGAIKPTVVVDTALALLQREIVLPALVWRDAAGDFRGAKDDTISIRVPAYVSANKRDLRSNDARVRSKLNERKVDVTLTSDLQVDIPISDEELTLDIRDFMRGVVQPALGGIVRGYEDEIATLISDATYDNPEVTMDPTDQGPYDALVDARKVLNDANVPMSERFAVVGSSMEAAILKSPQLARNDGGGQRAVNALSDASIGRLAGFETFISNALAPDEGFAFHRTAYALNTRAPFVPQGAPWGASLSAGGFAIRAVQVLDPDDIVNIFASDAWVGTNIVTDSGHFDGSDKFVPSTDPEDSGEDDLFVRAVKINLGS